MVTFYICQCACISDHLKNTFSNIYPNQALFHLKKINDHNIKFTLVSCTTDLIRKRTNQTRKKTHDDDDVEPIVKKKSLGIYILS